MSNIKRLLEELQEEFEGVRSIVNKPTFMGKNYLNLSGKLESKEEILKRWQTEVKAELAQPKITRKCVCGADMIEIKEGFFCDVCGAKINLVKEKPVGISGLDAWVDANDKGRLL